MPIELTKQSIQELLQRNDRAVKRALVVIHQRQTPEEKFAHISVEVNGIGFNQADAEFLTSLAEQVIEKDWLSGKQMAHARKRIQKYWQQLLEIAHEKLQEQ